MFSRNTPTAVAKAKPGRAAGSGLSFIDSEVVISGDFATTAQLHVDGRIDGNVTCAQLIQGADGIIAGNIQANEARLAGTVEGTVSANMVIVQASARILGDVAYETVSIEAGANIEGRLARRSALGIGEDSPALIAAPVSFSPAKKAVTTEGHGLFTLPDSAATN